jgi:hypothetical protein
LPSPTESRFSSASTAPLALCDLKVKLCGRQIRAESLERLAGDQHDPASEDGVFDHIVN